MKFFQVLIWFFLSFSAFSITNAAKLCERELAVRRNPIQKILEKPHELTPKQQVILNRHPLSRLFSERNIENIQIFPILDPEDDDPKFAFNGERVQVAFLMFLLRKAGFVGQFNKFPERWFDPDEPLSQITLVVRESAEQNMEAKLEDGKTERERLVSVEMSALKSANGKMDNRSKDSLRQLYNIPEGARVGHLYFNLFSENKRYSDRNPTLLDLVRRVRDLDADITIVSSISKFRDDYDLHLRGKESNLILTTEESLKKWAMDDQPDLVDELFDVVDKEFDHLFLLSDIQHGRKKIGSGKTILFNDTFYQMPDLHKIADFVFTIGPINFFEALYSGSPTAVLFSDEALGEYNREAAAKMRLHGSRFPNFQLIETLNEEFKAKQNTKEFPQINIPFRVFLNTLYKLVRRQLEIIDNQPASDADEEIVSKSPSGWRFD